MMNLIKNNYNKEKQRNLIIYNLNLKINPHSEENEEDIYSKKEQTNTTNCHMQLH